MRGPNYDYWLGNWVHLVFGWVRCTSLALLSQNWLGCHALAFIRPFLSTCFLSWLPFLLFSCKRFPAFGQTSCMWFPYAIFFRFFTVRLWASVRCGALGVSQVETRLQPVCLSTSSQRNLVRGCNRNIQLYKTKLHCWPVYVVDRNNWYTITNISVPYKSMNSFSRIIIQGFIFSLHFSHLKLSLKNWFNFKRLFSSISWTTAGIPMWTAGFCIMLLYIAFDISFEGGH